MENFFPKIVDDYGWDGQIVKKRAPNVYGGGTNFGWGSPSAQAAALQAQPVSSSDPVFTAMTSDLDRYKMKLRAARREGRGKAESERRFREQLEEMRIAQEAKEMRRRDLERVTAVTGAIIVSDKRHNMKQPKQLASSWSPSRLRSSELEKKSAEEGRRELSNLTKFMLKPQQERRQRNMRRRAEKKRERQEKHMAAMLRFGQMEEARKREMQRREERARKAYEMELYRHRALPGVERASVARSQGVVACNHFAIVHRLRVKEELRLLEQERNQMLRDEAVERAKFVRARFRRAILFVFCAFTFKYSAIRGKLARIAEFQQKKLAKKQLMELEEKHRQLDERKDRNLKAVNVFENGDALEGGGNIDLINDAERHRKLHDYRVRMLEKKRKKCKTGTLYVTLDRLSDLSIRSSLPRPCVVVQVFGSSKDPVLTSYSKLIKQNNLQNKQVFLFPVKNADTQKVIISVCSKPTSKEVELKSDKTSAALQGDPSSIYQKDLAASAKREQEEQNKQKNQKLKNLKVVTFQDGEDRGSVPKQPTPRGGAALGAEGEAKQRSRKSKKSDDLNQKEPYAWPSAILRGNITLSLSDIREQRAGVVNRVYDLAHDATLRKQRGEGDGSPEGGVCTGFLFAQVQLLPPDSAVYIESKKKGGKKKGKKGSGGGGDGGAVLGDGPIVRNEQMPPDLSRHRMSRDNVLRFRSAKPRLQETIIDKILLPSAGRSQQQQQ